MKRRAFLKTSALASTAAMAPSFLTQFWGSPLQNSRAGKILVVVQLSGGNDGLNTVVPFRNDVYYKSRPNLAIRPEEVLSLDGELGFNPALAALRELYEEGMMTVVNNVGYPNPDRSHFRSMDIWQTASPSDQYWPSGWLGRYLDSNCQGCASPYQAIEVDDSLSLALKGVQRRGFAVSDPGQLSRSMQNPVLRSLGQQYKPHADHSEEVAYLYKVLLDTQSSAEYLSSQMRKKSSQASYPATPFGRDLKQIAELILADTDTRIYYVSLSGFDTHARQKGIQERLLQQYAEGMKAFVGDLRQNDLLDDTLVLTFSEFGRRVAQNGSQGTDHGAANNLFLLGGKLRKPGFFNEGPDLSRLDEGDLIYSIDFRNVYADILDQWLEADAGRILSGSFPKLGLI